ncbi:hypothetical protein GGR56DRAFT_686974 [Xylariaceae sp. FL0804]|nr:hypothetical protein GGR56DRAFT_686974 [Xylariaceae sp. FL0804]
MAIETRAIEVKGVTWTMLVLSTASSLLRIYCRGWVIKAFALDDWLAAAAQMWWTCEPLYVLSNMAIKASISIFLLRLCVSKLHRMIVWAVFVATECYSFFFFILFILQCRPTSLFWLRYTDSPPEGSCLTASVVTNTFYGYSTISCITDWVYSILPIFLVSSLQMNLRMKISVICILGAGAIASSATIVRFPYIHTLTDIDDFLYSTTDVAIWSTVETGLGITAAGVATLRPLLKAWFRGGSSAGNNTSVGPYRKTDAKSRTHEVFDMHVRSATRQSHKSFGISTLIDHDVEGQRQFDERGADASEEAADSFAEGLDGSPSRHGSVERPDQPRRGRGWTVHVQKSIVQTSSRAV